jgi:hypothetical protein
MARPLLLIWAGGIPSAHNVVLLLSVGDQFVLPISLNHVVPLWYFFYLSRLGLAVASRGNSTATGAMMSGNACPGCASAERESTDAMLFTAH